MTGGAAARSISVDLNGAAELALVVTDAGDGAAYDHADWADLRASCN
jgi:alpha-galactosidase